MLPPNAETSPLHVIRSTLRLFVLIKKKANINEVSGQGKSSARVKAESDLRNNLSMAAMLKAYTGDINPHLKMNLDFTQYYIEENTGTILVVKNGFLGESLHAPAIIEASFEISIKYLHFHNSLGVLAPAVIVVADDTLGENDCLPYMIKGASGVNSNDAAG